MNWPWKRFEAFYVAHVRRLAVEEAVAVRNSMISGIWSNANIDDNERNAILTEIQDTHNAAIFRIYNQEYDGNKIHEAELPDHPLFAAIDLSGPPPS